MLDGGGVSTRLLLMMMMMGLRSKEAETDCGIGETY